MANFRRKRPKKQPRCTLCTPHRWRGNSKKQEGRLDPQTQRRTQEETESGDE